MSRAKDFEHVKKIWVFELNIFIIITYLKFLENCYEEFFVINFHKVYINRKIGSRKKRGVA